MTYLSFYKLQILLAPILKRMKIVAVVILYNPGKEVISNILSYAGHVEKIYVIDNSEKTNEIIKKNIHLLPNAIYVHDGENKGIANRLNYACSRASIEEANWLLTMDQDSSFAEKDISTYITCMEGLANKEQIAMTGVEFVKKETEEINCRYREVTSLITSGSVINLALFNKIGQFDEALFIDQVDLEYCYRAILKGYKIIKFGNVFLEHSLGISSFHISLKTFKSTHRTLHSPIRIYYITRNYLYIRSRYKKNFRTEIAKTEKDLFIRLKNNLLYGKERIAVLKFFFKGIMDFKRKKMGKIYLRYKN